MSTITNSHPNMLKGRRRGIEAYEQRIAKRLAKGRRNVPGLQAPDDGAYLPTPEEIREQCETLQARWTPAERRYRYLVARTIGSVAGLEVQPYSFPTVDQSQLCVDFSVG